MNNLQQTLLRSVLKIGAGVLISKGLVDQDGGEQLVAVLLALLGIVWGIMHRGPTRAGQPSATAESAPVLRSPKDSNASYPDGATKFMGVIVLFLFALLLIGCSGCALVRPPVPTTEIKATVGGQKFVLSNPKNTSVSGIAFNVETNGTATLTIATLSSTNDVQVIDKAYAGQAAVIHEVGIIQHQAAQDAIAGVGTAAGAAVK